MSELLKDKQIKTKGNKCCEVTLSVRYILSIFLHSKKITFNLRVAVPLSPKEKRKGFSLRRRVQPHERFIAFNDFTRKKFLLEQACLKFKEIKVTKEKKS